MNIYIIFLCLLRKKHHYNDGVDDLPEVDFK